MDGPTPNEAMRRRSRDYARIEKAIGFIEANFRTQPELADIARAVHLSPYHFQRLFTAWAGISPTRFMHYLTVGYARERLENAVSVLDAALDAGLSGPGRLHDLFVTYEAVSPGEHKRRGEGLTIRHGVHEGPFGRFVIAASERGICRLSFVDDDGGAALTELMAKWPMARFHPDRTFTAALSAQVFMPGTTRPKLGLHVQGTNFQIKVWEALMHVPPGAMVAYNHIGAAVKAGRAPRAIGNAMGANPIAFLIPCHRVIAASGAAPGYRWGNGRRKAMLAWEAAKFGDGRV